MNNNQKSEQDQPRSLVDVSVSDQLGLSAPLKSLVESLSQGVGSWLAPHILKRSAAAAGTSLEKLDDILKGRGLQPSHASLTLEERASLRMTYTAVQRQKNLESVVNAAADDCATQECAGSEDIIDPDWLNRFINYAQDISKTEMQKVWARVLSKESTRPGYFSYRALDTLACMSASDAEIFRRMCNLSYKYESQEGVLLPDHTLNNTSSSDRLNEIRTMLNGRDANWMHSFGIFYTTSFIPSLIIPNTHATLQVSGVTLKISATFKTESMTLCPHFEFTPLGSELRSLIEPETVEQYVAAVKEDLTLRKFNVEEIRYV